jgi:hypothetical protein
MRLLGKSVRHLTSLQHLEQNQVDDRSHRRSTTRSKQAYLLLACAASPPVTREFRGLLNDVVQQSPHRMG